MMKNGCKRTNCIIDTNITYHITHKSKNICILSGHLVGSGVLYVHVGSCSEFVGVRSEAEGRRGRGDVFHAQFVIAIVGEGWVSCGLILLFSIIFNDNNPRTTLSTVTSCTERITTTSTTTSTRMVCTMLCYNICTSTS